MVTHQLQVRCRPVKVRRSETDVLPLSYTANQLSALYVRHSYHHTTMSFSDRRRDGDEGRGLERKMQSVRRNWCRDFQAICPGFQSPTIAATSSGPHTFTFDLRRLWPIVVIYFSQRVITFCATLYCKIWNVFHLKTDFVVTVHQNVKLIMNGAVDSLVITLCSSDDPRVMERPQRCGFRGGRG